MNKLNLNTAIFISLLLIAMLLNGCKKEEKVPTTTDKLTSYTWIVTAAKFEPAVQIDQYTKLENIYIMEPCFQDDKYKFSTSGTYNFDKAGQCNVNDLSYNGTWSFQNSESQILLSNYGNSGLSKLVSITELTTSIFNFYIPISNQQDVSIVLKSYGLEGYLSKAGSPVSIQEGTKFKMTYRAL